MKKTENYIYVLKNYEIGKNKIKIRCYSLHFWVPKKRSSASNTVKPRGLAKKRKQAAIIKEILKDARQEANENFHFGANTVDKDLKMHDQEQSRGAHFKPSNLCSHIRNATACLHVRMRHSHYTLLLLHFFTSIYNAFCHYLA